MRLRRAVLVALMAALLAAMSPALAHAEQVSSFADYRHRVDAAEDYARRTLPESWRVQTDSQVAAEQLNTYLPGTERVQVGTRTIDVDNSVLRSLIARLDFSHSSAERRDTGVDIVAHLGSLRMAVDEADGGAAYDPALLTRLLARPDLASRPTVSDELAKLLDRLSRWLAAWFARVMQQKGAATGSDIALVVVFIALGLLLVFAVVRVVRAMSASLARHDTRVLAEAAADRAAVVSAAEGLPPDALGYADELAEAGRFREAVRALFGGAARTLVDLGLLRSTRTRTNAELLADLEPTAPPVLPSLSDLSASFERTWYGHADPGRDGFDAARERYRESVRTAERAKSERERAEAAS